MSLHISSFIDRKIIELGLTALKFDLDTPIDTEPDPANGRLSNAAIQYKIETVEMIRDTTGDETDLAFDCYWNYSLESGKHLARKLEPYDLMWLEDVLSQENMRAQRKLAPSTAVLLATDENRFRIYEFAGSFSSSASIFLHRIRAPAVG